MPHPQKRGRSRRNSCRRSPACRRGTRSRSPCASSHDPHWHTYWINPGTGLPTEIRWALPAGWRAGPIQWPVPHVLIDSHGTVIGNGYDGEVFLPITLTPPAGLQAGTTVTLKAAVTWLMCKDVCMPGQADLELTLPVVGHAPAADPHWGAKLDAARAQLPRPADGWQIAASRAGSAVTLTVRPPAGISADPAELHFFAEDGLIAYDKPQTARPTNDGTVVLTLPVDESASKDATRLAGVLALAKGPVPGVRIDVPFGTARDRRPSAVPARLPPRPACLARSPSRSSAGSS